MYYQSEADFWTFELGLAVCIFYLGHRWYKQKQQRTLSQERHASLRKSGPENVRIWAHQLAKRDGYPLANDQIQPLGLAVYCGGHIGFPLKVGVALARTPRGIIVCELGHGSMRIEIPSRAILGIDIQVEHVPQLMNLNLAAAIANASIQARAKQYVKVTFVDTNTGMTQSLLLDAGFESGGCDALARNLYLAMSHAKAQ